MHKLNQGLLMYRYLSIPRRLLQNSSGSLFIMQNHPFCIGGRPGKDTKFYDLTKYEFPYTPEETNTILNILNQSSEEKLFEFKITKVLVKQLVRGRTRFGDFQKVSQLLDIDGFGLKNVENICNKLLKGIPSEDSSEEEEVQTKKLFYKKQLVKPRVMPSIIESSETILAVDITLGSLSWTLLDLHGMVLDIGIEELLTKAQRLDAPKLYDKMVSVVKNIPKADIYVWEERASYGYLQKASLGSIIIAIRLGQMRGILTALLDVREEGQVTGRLFYLRDLLVSRLFCLKVGEERISGLNIADDLMSCEKVYHWLPPLAVDRDTQEKYFSIDKLLRRQLSTSLFVGLAFHQTIIENNVCAHQVFIEG